EDLETRVREATERLRELKEENQSLQERVDELETKLLAAIPENLPGGMEPAEGSELAAAREENEALREQIADLELKLARIEETAGREREEIRGRVERLTRQLEGLVQA
ncbi:MAG: hypothetical protein ACLGI9_16635, partial [Thermoanaerobaculia bacterium]